MNGRDKVLICLTIAGVVASSLVLAGGIRASEGAAATFPTVVLPPGCVKPAGGYLVIMSEYGYNNSILEGAGPTKSWPVIAVTQGQTVKIAVCNVDTTEAHGFQIEKYYDNSVVAVAPGQVLEVSFVASSVGTFQIYCAIFCLIHPFMEYGQLRVTS